MKTITLEDLSYAGFIVKPSGFAGEVVFAAETFDAESFQDFNFLFLVIEGLPVPFRVTGSKMKSGNLIVKLEDIDTEEAAKSLNGCEAYVEELPEAEEVGVPSFSDLEGFTVIDRTAGNLGAILEVEELPMQFIARCNHQGHEIVFPLNETIVIGIDTERREIHVDLPDGLIDVYMGGGENDEPDE